MSIGSFFSSIGHKIASFFGSHVAVIQTVLTDAQAAATVAIRVATVVEPPAAGGGLNPIVVTLSGVLDGLVKVSGAVTAETTAETFAQHAADITGLVTGLVETTNDVGIKSETTKAAIGAALVKINGVVGALETAAAAPPAV